MNYPFTALVGQEQLKAALLLNAVYPGIGGVLIRGSKGTAKSTAARALAELLPSLDVIAGCPFNCDPKCPWVECTHSGSLEEKSTAKAAVPFVNLPLGATEDRVLGTLDFEKALREGKRSFQPGLLAAAHRGIVYIDEVNLLADHLVDVLLDAAAMGVNTVQREGVAITHPARFILVGTMNPEEGDLRPQLLDRFGLMVEVHNLTDLNQRTEVVRRRLAFEEDPVAFSAAWEKEQDALRERIVAARERLPSVTVADGILSMIARLCCECGVDGMRADIVLYKTARARAAFHDRVAVSIEDIRAAAELVLPHRRRRQPLEKPGLDKDRLDELLSKLDQKKSNEEQRDNYEEQTETSNCDKDCGDEGDGNEDERDNETTNPPGSQLFQPAIPAKVRPIEVESRGKTTRSIHGGRNTGQVGSAGPYIRATQEKTNGGLAIDATIRAAVGRGVRKNAVSPIDASGEMRVAVDPSDLRFKQRESRQGTLILFVVDASGSMAARRRMEAVKGAVVGLLRDAYQERDHVGVIAFRGLEAEVLLQPTDSVELAERALRELPTGGRTPLAHALVLAEQVLSRWRSSNPSTPALLVLFSDGKANVPLAEDTGDPWQQVLQLAERLKSIEAAKLVLDTEVGFVRSGRAQQVAEALAGECLSLEELSADNLLLQLRQRMMSVLDPSR